MTDTLTKTSLSRQNSFYGEKVQFLNWILKWICNGSAPEELPFDIPEIAAVLQAMGFELEKLERTIGDPNSGNSDESKIKITLHCTKSKMSAVLAKSDLVCKCPKSEVNNDAFWILGGSTATSSQEYINKTTEPVNSLLPIIPRGRSLLIKEIIYKLLTLVGTTDLNKNDEKIKTPAKLSKGQSFDNLCGAIVENVRPGLNRGQSWEVDPKTSPPISTSSPLPEMSSTERDQTIVELLTDMEEKLKKAISLLPAKHNTFTLKKTVKRVSNIRKTPVSSPTRATSGHSSTSISSKLTPNKPATPKRTPQTTLASAGQKHSVPSKISTFRKKYFQTPTPDKTKIHKDTPLLNSNQSERKPITLAARTTTLRSSNPNLASCTSSGLNKNRSGIPSLGSRFTKPTSTSTTSLKKFK